MDKESSTYLDLVRFCAAFVVLIVHSYSPNLTGGYLWPMAGYGDTAVMIFFVLSGYVIAFVAVNRETSLLDYSFARVSRLYSVVVPAIFVTVVANILGDLYLRQAYTGPWQSGADSDGLRYLLTMAMLQDVWSLKLYPRNNGPFWSITFEAFYYAMFAALYYVRSRNIRVFIFLILCLIAGPIVVLLFPIWLLGVLAYWINSRSGKDIARPLALFLFISTFVLMLFSREYRAVLDSSDYFAARDSIAGDYIDGILFFIHLIAMPRAVGVIAAPLLRFRSQIVFLASGTFSLYLFHQPLVRLFAGVSPFIEYPGSLQNIAFVYLPTLLVVYGLGRPIEGSKKALAALMRRYTLKYFQNAQSESSPQ